MRYMRQFSIILGVTFIGEVLRYFIPLPVPAGIYGLVLMFLLLLTGAVRTEQIQETSDFLIEIMTVMFIPAAVGLLDNMDVIKPLIIPISAMIALSTSLVIGVTGRTAQFLLRKGGKRDE